MVFRSGNNHILPSDNDQLISLTGLSTKQKDKEVRLITKVKNVPNYYIYILIHLFYKGPATLTQLARLTNRPESNTRLSLIRMIDLGMIVRSDKRKYSITTLGRNEVEALRSMFFQ